MAFNTNVFIFIFLPITIFLHRILDKKYKSSLLLLASLLFYAWSGVENLKFILILLVVNYIFLFINHKFKKKLILGIIVFFNVFLLIYYKYANYIIENMMSYFSLEIPLFNLIVPLGISFIIFHAISLHVDIFRNNELFSSNIIDFGMYLVFFPKMLQGPIVLYKDFIAKTSLPDYSLDFFCLGVERFIIGLSKKVLIADVLLNVVNTMLGYLNTSSIDQPTYWIIAISYMFVIYFDFSGYSDMAIGISKMCGYDFKENFNFPYISTSITEFWRRWHISLGSWFKEYVYIPLGGNRKGNVYIHIAIVFLLTGMWHGAGLMYLLWGILHGSFRLIEKYLQQKNILDKIPSLLGWMYTTLVVGFGWLIFLFPRKEPLFSFLNGLIGNASDGYIPFTYSYILDTKVIVTLTIAIAGSYLLANSRIQAMYNKFISKSKGFAICKYLILLILLVYSIVSIISGTYSPFIYFQY